MVNTTPKIARAKIKHGELIVQDHLMMRIEEKNIFC